MDRIADAGTPLLFLTGGELFTRRDIWEILEAAHARGLRLVVSTNGTLIDRSDIRRLKGLGVDYAAVSIYGPRDFHDGYVVVPGSFDRTIETARIMREEGIGIAVKTVVNADTLPRFDAILEITKEIGARVIYACDLVTTGRASDMGTREIGPAEWRTLADRIVEEILADPDGLEFDIGAQPSIVPYIAMRLRERGHDIGRALARLENMTACPVGRGHMTINAKGDIMPCSFMQDHSVGNVRDVSLAEAARTLFDLGKQEVTGSCAACEFVKICRGCRAKALCGSGDILGEDPACVMAEA